MKTNETTKLKGNAAALNLAIEKSENNEPGSTIVLDGGHRGTLFSWLGRHWCVVDLENKKLVGFVDRLAVVTLRDNGDDDLADRGLNQAAIGFDFGDYCAEWVVDCEDLEDLQETYGEDLEVIWRQPA